MRFDCSHFASETHDFYVMVPKYLNLKTITIRLAELDELDEFSENQSRMTES